MIAFPLPFTYPPDMSVLDNKVQLSMAGVSFSVGRSYRAQNGVLEQNQRRSVSTQGGNIVWDVSTQAG